MLFTEELKKLEVDAEAHKEDKGMHVSMFFFFFFFFFFKSILELMIERLSLNV